MANLINIILINGFLGSGKTTLLKRWISETSDYKIGIIENEFGEVGIDGDLIRTEGITLQEINNGSIFCSCRHDEFIEALIKLTKYPLDFLLVESSGISDPVPMKSDIEIVQKQIGNKYNYLGNLCIIDCIDILDMLEVLESVNRQIKFAQIIFLNKIDLLPPQELEELQEKLKTINISAKYFQTEYCNILFSEVVSYFISSLNSHNQVSVEDLEGFNTIHTSPQKLLLSTNKIITQENLNDFFKNFDKQTFRIKGYLQTQEAMFLVDGVRDRLSYSKQSIPLSPTKIVIILKKGDILGEIIADAWKKQFT